MANTSIRVNCPECEKDQRLTSKDVILRMKEGEDSGSYVFVCPGCGGRIVKDASVHIVDLLKGADVRVIIWTMPEELYDPNRSSERGVVSLDDVLDLYLALEAEDFIERLAWGDQ